MEPYLWGPHMWNLLLEIARIAPSLNRNDLILFLYALRWVAPCKHCRKHYSDNLVILKPEEARDFVLWVYTLKNLVNQSQGREITLSEAQLRVRLATTPQLLSAENYWYLLTLLAANYPVKGQEAEDADAYMKRHAYAIFFYYLGRLTKNIPHLRNLINTKGIMGKANKLHKRLNAREFTHDNFAMVSMDRIGSQDTPRFFGIPPSTPFAWTDRHAIVKWVAGQYHHWERGAGLSREQTEINRKYQKQLLEFLNNPEKKVKKQQSQPHAPLQLPQSNRPPAPPPPHRVISDLYNTNPYFSSPLGV